MVLLDADRVSQYHTDLTTAVTVVERYERQSVNLLATLSRVPVIARLQLFPGHVAAVKANSKRLARICGNFIVKESNFSSFVVLLGNETTVSLLNWESGKASFL
jgi:hypothetical protein